LPRSPCFRSPCELARNLTKSEKRRHFRYKLDTTIAKPLAHLPPQIVSGGEPHTPIGGRINAEEFYGLLESDPDSVVYAPSSWTPIIKKFRMPEVLKMAGAFLSVATHISKFRKHINFLLHPR
jgi:hypothetical protein